MTTKGTNYSPADPRIICFERKEDIAAFDASLSKLLSVMQKRAQQSFINEENVLRMNHGGSWIHTARESESDTKLHTLSAEWQIPYKEIANNDLSLISKTVISVHNNMLEQFTKNMYDVIGDAAENVGNSVTTDQNQSFAVTFLEILRKIELGVDKDGNVCMPQIHVGMQLAKRIEQDLNNIDPHLAAEIEKVKATKIEEAQVTERKRKSKFKSLNK